MTGIHSKRTKKKIGKIANCTQSDIEKSRIEGHNANLFHSWINDVSVTYFDVRSLGVHMCGFLRPNWTFRLSIFYVFICCVLSESNVW